MSTVAASIPAPRASGWRQLIGFNILTGILLGIGGWYLGHFIGDHIHGANTAYYSTQAGQNDIAIMLGYFLGVDGASRRQIDGERGRAQRRGHPSGSQPDFSPDAISGPAASSAI